ncbi:hypothetical protein BH11MYX2_BH11MYX2_29900 [soil metagenome]
MTPRSFTRAHGVTIAAAIGAVVIAWAYAGTTRHAAGAIGLPLDDSYVYLQFARHPFEYTRGFSSGSTSALWPITLAPLRWFGVWGAFIACLSLFTAVVIGVSMLARRIVGGACSSIVATAIILGVPAFAWTALSGMDVALTAALLFATAGVLAVDPMERPTRRALAVLALTGLARPEAVVIVLFVCSASAIGRRQWRWLLPLLAPIAWFALNRVMTGHWMPASAIAKAQWNQPGFAWSAWWSDLVKNTGACVKGIWWDAASPLPQPRVCALLYLVGVARIVIWARREKRVGVVGVIVGAPLVFAGATLAATGMWTLHHYRYLMPALPMIAVPIGVAIAPVTRWPRSRRASIGLAVVCVAAIARIAGPRHRVHAMTYAQGVADTNAQVVKLGRYVGEHLPDAVLLVHDAGALAYYSHVPVVDMPGLVTEGMARIANNGPGARFEWLESLPAEQRPTHLAYYRAWLGTDDFFGPTIIDGFLPSKFAPERVAGDEQMILAPIVWDHVGTGERPLDMQGELVDRVDIADLASEDAHAWSGALGVRSWADLSARWSLVGRDPRMILDGGRTIRGGREEFVIARRAGQAAQLVVRTGGPAQVTGNERVVATQLHVRVDGHDVGTLALPAPMGPFNEVALTLPAAGSSSRVEITSPRPYRVFHWFVLATPAAPL